MKKVLNLILTTAMTLSLAACSGNTPSGSDPTPPSGPSSGNGSTSNVPVSDDVGEHRWICGIDSPKDAVAFYYIEKMSQELDRLSNGNMTIEIYTDGTLGGDVALLESLASGNVNFVVQNPAPEVNIMPKLAVFDLPCAFSNIEEFRTAIDSPKLLEQLYPIYEQAGYKLLGFADQTFRVMTSNKKVEKIEDFQGIKIRTMENPNHMAFWTAWGASPTPMAFSEVYTGLQQGTVLVKDVVDARVQAAEQYAALLQDPEALPENGPDLLHIAIGYGVENKVEHAVRKGERLRHVRLDDLNRVSLPLRHHPLPGALFAGVVQHRTAPAQSGKDGHLLSPSAGQAQDLPAPQLPEPLVGDGPDRRQVYVPSAP